MEDLLKNFNICYEESIKIDKELTNRLQIDMKETIQKLTSQKQNIIFQQLLDYVESKGEFIIITELPITCKEKGLTQNIKVEFFTVRQCINRSLTPKHQILIRR